MNAGLEQSVHCFVGRRQLVDPFDFLELIANVFWDLDLVRGEVVLQRLFAEAVAGSMFGEERGYGVFGLRVSRYPALPDSNSA
jgi:hypothetical protein